MGGPSGAAPGYRNYGNGTLYHVGYGGYSWSSVPTGSNTYYLYFYYGGIGPQYNNYRAHGLPVRCLQE